MTNAGESKSVTTASTGSTHWCTPVSSSASIMPCRTSISIPIAFRKECSWMARSSSLWQPSRCKMCLTTNPCESHGGRIYVARSPRRIRTGERRTAAVKSTAVRRSTQRGTNTCCRLRAHPSLGPVFASGPPRNLRDRRFFCGPAKKLQEQITHLDRPANTSHGGPARPAKTTLTPPTFTLYTLAHLPARAMRSLRNQRRDDPTDLILSIINRPL